MAHALGLTNVRIAHGRAEELARSPMHRGRHTIVISRAVDDLHVLARWCPPLLAPVPDARLIVWKGGDLSQEITATRRLPVVRSIETIPLDLPGEPWFAREQKHLVEVRFEIH